MQQASRGGPNSLARPSQVLTHWSLSPLPAHTGPLSQWAPCPPYPATLSSSTMAGSGGKPVCSAQLSHFLALPSLLWASVSSPVKWAGMAPISSVIGHLAPSKCSVSKLSSPLRPHLHVTCQAPTLPGVPSLPTEHHSPIRTWPGCLSPALWASLHLSSPQPPLTGLQRACPCLRPSKL